MGARQVRVLQGRTFMVSDASGDVRRDPRVPNGLFYRDMRHLSHWEIRLDGRRPEAISGTAVELGSDRASISCQGTGQCSAVPWGRSPQPRLSKYQEP